MTDARCEPPLELRGKDGWHWVQWTQTPGYEVECQQWFAEDGGFWGSDDIHMEGWRYLSPVLTPAEVAALRAERDAAWNEVEREREKYKADMAALVEVARWSQRSGLQDAELTTLRAEVEKLREALEWSHSAFVAQRDQAPARKRLMALTIKNCRMAVVDIVAQSRAALKAPQP